MHTINDIKEFVHANVFHSINGKMDAIGAMGQLFLHKFYTIHDGRITEITSVVAKICNLRQDNHNNIVTKKTFHEIAEMLSKKLMEESQSNDAFLSVIYKCQGLEANEIYVLDSNE